MENLLALVDKIQQVSPLSVFEKEVFIVQNAGMQHWLNMSIANNRGISLNIDYALPAQFLWKLAKTLSNQGVDIEQAPFSREALCWRIYAILGQDNVINNPVFSSATSYWYKKSTQKNETLSSEKIKNSCENAGNSNPLKRYQLACQVADLFEQYLVFRPDWIDNWGQGKEAKNPPDNTESFTRIEQWQSALWLILTKEQDYNPKDILERAVNNLSQHQSNLPKRVCFFGINAMAPMWLSFINELSQYCEVHFFHLNPCENYWGDILTDKQAISNSHDWLNGSMEYSESVGNPLLANLGQQGREFLALLQQYSVVNIDAFDADIFMHSLNQQTTLSRIQHDILTLTDARLTYKADVDDFDTLNDNSIVITSAHSALREVQGLHDWLLHQFNDHESLTPKDILVMCPQVEQYAPYINAVFAKGWQELDSNIPPLPCSISDRIAKDSDPLVTVFSELMTLPDSRFQVSLILSWMRLPAIQNKFSLTIEEIEKITVWVQNACIHWGINEEHQQSVLNADTLSSQFSWQYGLSRLLQGFAFSDQLAVHHEYLLLPDVEGNDALLLGKLMLLIEQLQFFNEQLLKTRTPTQWQQFLVSFIDDFFTFSETDNASIIYSAIESFIENCQHASFEGLIELPILREYLNTHFSQPDTGSQFMVGQVTFCSMLPMRSIPFKVVAILGLNDGEYPRQRVPLGFDLMAISEYRVGDRSRRGDDRYLFLEAIISARQSLYLSYQGRSIKNNNERQPSIVLKELQDYLSQGYGWNLTNHENSHLRQLPMQPYSELNYVGKYAGFDKKWLALSPKRALESDNSSAGFQNEGSTSPLFVIPNCTDITENAQEASHETLTINSQTLIQFFNHPSKYFAKQQLALFLEDNTTQLSDIEPFDADHLSRYLFKEEALACFLSIEHEGNKEDESAQEAIIESLQKNAKLSGKFPPFSQEHEQINKLIEDSVTFTRFIQGHLHHRKPQAFDVHITFPFMLDTTMFNDEDGLQIKESCNHCYQANNQVEMSTKVQVIDQRLISYRSSLPKMKDFLGLYLNLLMVQIFQKNQLANNVASNNHEAVTHPLMNITSSHGYFFDSKSQKTVEYSFELCDAPTETLLKFIALYIYGRTRPLLLNGDLAGAVFKAKVFEQPQFEKFWQDPNGISFSDDPYIDYFWPECPEFSEISALLENTYALMMKLLQQVKS